MSKINFTDLRPEFSGSETYASSNENLTVLRQIVEKHGPYRNTGGICSSGDVFLTVVLPFAKRYVAVDHNYGSLRNAMTKVLFLQNHSIAEVWALVSMPANAQKLLTILKELRAELPECSGFPAPPLDSLSGWCSDWVAAGEALLTKAKDRLDEVSFIHGDLRDLKESHPHYDLIYMSNALEHHSFTGGFADDAREIESIFNATSMSLHTHGDKPKLGSSSSSVWKRHEFMACEDANKLDGTRAGWSYSLHEKVGKVAQRFAYMAPTPRKTPIVKSFDIYGWANNKVINHAQLASNYLLERQREKSLRPNT